MFLASDNTGPVHPRIMAALAEANDGFAPAYGADDLSEQVRARLRDLFEAYSRDPTYLPEDWRPAALLDEAGHVALVSDFIAGMTDRFALDEHRRLFDSPPKLR